MKAFLATSMEVANKILLSESNSISLRPSINMVMVNSKWKWRYPGIKAQCNSISTTLRPNKWHPSRWSSYPSSPARQLSSKTSCNKPPTPQIMQQTAVIVSVPGNSPPIPPHSRRIISHNLRLPKLMAIMQTTCSNSNYSSIRSSLCWHPNSTLWFSTNWQCKRNKSQNYSRLTRNCRTRILRCSRHR